MIQRWVFTDPSTGESYTVPINPNAMTPLFPAKQLTFQATTAIDGQLLMWEGQPQPQDWQFSGDILDEAHHEALRSWVYDHQGRLQITDHFGRQLLVVLRSFEPTPKRAVGKYWRHTYLVRGTVISVGAPTVLA